MYIKKITIFAWALNFVLVGMCGYIYGVHTGMTMDKEVDMQMQIRYAILQAMKEGQ